MDRSYLIVDDNRAFADNVAEIVRDLGDEIAVVESGTAALQLVRRKRFDALVTDMRMPVMDGAELVHQARRIDPGLPAIVVTAHVGDRELAAARSEGLLAVLSKPVPIHGLLSLLGTARRDGLVVIVEDDQSLSDNLCESLREHGFAAVIAASVLETERLGPIRPFLALADLRVPGGPAGEAMRRLSEKYPGIPRVVMSGYPDQAPVTFDVRFTKPFDSATLIASVQRLHAGRPASAPAS